MHFIHRLVIVIAGVGALIMLWGVGSAFGTVWRGLEHSTTWYAMATPGIIAAMIIYPAVWLFSGFHR